LGIYIIEGTSNVFHCSFKLIQRQAQRERVMRLIFPDRIRCPIGDIASAPSAPNLAIN
jgi:hypothetical protein